MIRALFAALGPAQARPLRVHLTALVAYGVLQGLAFVVLVPVLRALLNDNAADATRWLIVLAVIVVAAAAAYVTQALLGYRVGIAVSRAVHHRLGDHLATLPLGWFTAEKVGRVGRMASKGVIDIMGVPAHLIAPIVTAVVTPATVVVGMVFLDWRLALALVALVPLLVVVYRWAGGLVARSDHAVDDAGAEAAGRVVEFVQAQAVLRAHRRVEHGFAELEGALAAQEEAGRKQLWTAVPGLAGFILALQAAVTVALVVGAVLALGGSIDVAELIALLVLVVRFAEPLVTAADLGTALRIAANSLGRVNDLLATPTLPEPSSPAIGHPADGSVALNGVSFSYGASPVLTDVSLRIPARTMTAVVGASGSGKTTLTRLIARFFDVGSGSVSVGGTDVREQTTEQLMGQLSLVFQDVYLFDDTILENIRAGRAGASDSEVREAARLAQVDEIVARLPGGWDARVGEGGAKLSGGERQRVSIARAILKDAPIVLLDEATAALDPANEAAVGQALAALTADRTLLVIAHRLQTVRAADQIVVLDAGRVAEVGTHEELLAAGGRYAAFLADRDRSKGWRLVSAHA